MRPVVPKPTTGKPYNRETSNTPKAPCLETARDLANNGE